MTLFFTCCQTIKNFSATVPNILQTRVRSAVFVSDEYLFLVLLLSEYLIRMCAYNMTTNIKKNNGCHIIIESDD